MLAVQHGDRKGHVNRLVTLQRRADPATAAELSWRSAFAGGLPGEMPLGIHEVQLPMDLGCRGVEQLVGPSRHWCPVHLQQTWPVP